jgi:hypothetical protein
VFSHAGIEMFACTAVLPYFLAYSSMSRNSMLTNPLFSGCISFKGDGGGDRAAFF